MKRFAHFTLLLALSAPLAYAGDIDPAAAQAIEAAEAKVQEVEEAGFLWKSTKDILAQAREAAKKGETDKAVDLANKAKHQAELGLKQANQKVDPRF